MQTSQNSRGQDWTKTLASECHDQLSRRVLLPLLRWQQQARPSHRAIAQASCKGLKFRRGSANWSDDEKRAWMLHQLRITVRYAARSTVYYRDILHSVGFDPQADFTFEDYAKLPVLEKTDLQQHGSDMLSLPRELTLRIATGGSTGTPTEVFAGPGELGWRDSGREYELERIGLPSGFRRAAFWGHNLDPVASPSLTDRISSFILNQRWFDCFRLSPELLERTHAGLECYQPDGVVAYASALAALAEHVLDSGHHPTYPNRCFVTGAEKLLPQHRALIERAFGRPVHEQYGTRDVGLIGFQADPAAGLEYTIDWPWVMVEPETNNEECSAVLITKFHADGMPLLRYRVGDEAQFCCGSRPGHPTFALKEVLGRVTDRVYLPNGGWISGNQFPHLLKDYAIREFMVHQQADYSLDISLLARPGFNADDCEKLRATIGMNLPGVPLRFKLVDNIARNRANKWRPVITDVVKPDREVCA